MEAIIYKTEAGANTFQNVLFESISHLVDSNTTKYSNVIKHPTLNLWAVQVAVNGLHWFTINNAIGERKVETLTEDWFPKNDLE